MSTTIHVQLSKTYQEKNFEPRMLSIEVTREVEDDSYRKELRKAIDNADEEIASYFGEVEE